MPENRENTPPESVSREGEANPARQLARILRHHGRRLQDIFAAPADAAELTAAKVRLLEKEVENLQLVLGLAKLLLSVEDSNRARKQEKRAALEKQLVVHAQKLARDIESELVERPE